jgi:hypothetical protein
MYLSVEIILPLQITEAASNLNRHHAWSYKVFDTENIRSEAMGKFHDCARFRRAALAQQSLPPTAEFIESLCTAVDAYLSLNVNGVAILILDRAIAPITLVCVQHFCKVLAGSETVLPRLYLDTCEFLSTAYPECRAYRSHHLFLRNWVKIYPSPPSGSLARGAAVKLTSIRMNDSPKIKSAGGAEEVPHLSFVLVGKDGIIYTSRVQQCDASAAIDFPVPVRAQGDIVFKLYHRPPGRNENNLLLTCVLNSAFGVPSPLRVSANDLDEVRGDMLPPTFSLEFFFSEIVPDPEVLPVVSDAPAPLPPIDDLVSNAPAPLPPIDEPSGDMAATIETFIGQELIDADEEFARSLQAQFYAEGSLPDSSGPPPATDDMSPAAMERSLTERLAQYLQALEDGGRQRRDGGIRSLIRALPVGSVRGGVMVTQRCLICCAAFEVGDNFRTLPCLHFYHTVCIDEWLPHKPECPVCKTAVSGATVHE